MKKIHYPNLNFLRGFAALVVIIHHTEQLKSIHGYPNIWNNESISLLGKLGVDLFFVLSGFLITSLLFVEKEVVKKISIRKFLMRRVLRIWPVYFLVLIIAFFITPNIPELTVGPPFISPKPYFITSIFLYVFFLPHIQAFIIGPIAYCAQAWSIGIEEYFYVFWPFVISKLTTKKIVWFIIVFIVVYLFICCASIYLGHTKYANDTLFKQIKICITQGLKFDCLLIGGLFAIINNNLKDNATIITTRSFQVVIYIIEVLLVIFPPQIIGGFDWEVHAVIYGFIILNLVRSKTSILNLEHTIFNFLGKISYGMYMYHFLIVNICILIVNKIGMPILLYPMIFTGVILVATFSYKYFEGFFLKKKLTYSTIITG
ncbi:MAG: acyltransferase [Mucilaginibacter sp.]|nr:acyltransferase [Mucilaginibacter sp.]